jgi:hypothetical protein
MLAVPSAIRVHLVGIGHIEDRRDDGIEIEDRW